MEDGSKPTSGSPYHLLSATQSPSAREVKIPSQTRDDELAYKECSNDGALHGETPDQNEGLFKHSKQSFTSTAAPTEKSPTGGSVLTELKAGFAPRNVDSEVEDFSDTGRYLEVQRRPPRPAKKRADIQATIREKFGETAIEPVGNVWAVCCASELKFDELLAANRRGQFDLDELCILSSYSEVIFCRCFKEKIGFCFRFGCFVGWDLTKAERKLLDRLLRGFLKDPLLPGQVEDDEMNYVWAEHRAIKQDTIHLVTDNYFERLAYSYAFAQSVKLSFFEANVDDTIERTKTIPEGLAKTGTIQAKREDISRRIGELFISRFYINLHTDILDTPDIFWESDEFQDHYSSCRSYLEIPKRVDILNQRLDIIKDLYDMLNDELTIQHGHRLEWIVIYLICVEVAIELVWNILIRDVLHLV